jgi:hypothetical protein
MRAPAVLVFGWTLPLAGLGVGLFGVLRLTRQFPAAASSPSLLVPFLLPVLALALEAGALVAFSASALRLFRLLPTRPIVPRLVGLLPLAGLLALVLGLAEALPRGTERPGAFANELIESARRSCGSGGSAGSVPVPLLGLSVRCDRGSTIEGPMPGVPSVQLAMQSLSFSDDLRRVQIRGLDLTAKRAFVVRLRARDAQISGLAPWARSARLSPFQRCGLLSAIGLALAFVASLFWRPAAAADPVEAEKARRWVAAARAALGGLPGLAAAIVVITLDQDQATPAAYASAVVAGLMVLFLLFVLDRRVPKIFSSFSSF